ncbi:MAG: hypothetical protein Q3979_03515 [Actinomycetaceae bacterium]|nr:hypothetical protein [Actinomycetaceae bacterium]
MDTNAIKAGTTVNVSGEDLTGPQLIDKILEENENSQVPATIDGKLDMDITGTPNDASVDGNLEFKYDRDKEAFSLKVDGKVEDSTNNEDFAAQVLGEQDGSNYKVYGEYGGQWAQTEIARDQIEALMQQAQAQSASQSDTKASEYLDMYADVEVTESGDDLVVRAAPKAAVLKELATRSEGGTFEVDPDNSEAFLRLVVNKDDLQIKSFAAAVDVKSKDGKGSIKGELSFDIDMDADVSVTIPDEAKNGQPFAIEDLFNAMGIGAGSVDNSGDLSLEPSSDELPSSDDPLSVDDADNAATS